MNKDDKIKTFIKLEFSELKKEDLYEVDESKKFIKIFNSEKKNQKFEKKSYPFEFDKIFIESDSNSYIYEEICLNCIKQSFEGISFNFISFGDSYSNKFNLLFGKIEKNINNINNHGIFIRYLKEMLNKNKKYNFNIKLSAMLLYDDKLVDLLDVFNINKKGNKIINNNKLFKNAIKIGKDTNIINKMKKIGLNSDDNINTIILLLHNLINSLLKLENEKDNFIYSLSNICFQVYLDDKNENKISTSTFLLLNGCEHIYDANNQKLNRGNENSISTMANNLLNIQVTYDGIINCIKSNKYISEQINIKSKIERKKSLDNYKSLKENKEEEKKLPSREEGFNEEMARHSKLILLLYNISFNKDLKNIKFRIIGNIYPIPDYFKTTRDTLLFCSKCYKILNKTNAGLTLTEETKKENDINDLNFRIKLQMRQIESLSQIIEKKNSHINFLSKHYNAQINAIKKYFGFQGDPNTLIAKDINIMKEDSYIKNVEYKMIKQQEEIDESKIRIEELEQELIKYKNLTSIKINDETMINYYLSVKNKNMKKNLENNLINSLSKEIMELKEKIKNKDKIIEGLKQDLNEKNNVCLKLHEIKYKEKKEEKEKEKEKRIKGENETAFIDYNLMLKTEIEKIKIDEERNIRLLEDKCEAILKEKKSAIYSIEQKLDKVEGIYKKEIETFNKELVRLYEIVLQLINGYQDLFDKNNKKIDMKKKEEFDKTIINIDKDINYFNFTTLYKELNKQNKTKQSIIESLTNEIIYKIGKKINNNIDIEKETLKKNKIIISSKEMEINELNNKLITMSHYLKDQVNQNNTKNIIINSQKLTIDRMKTNELIYESLLRNKKIDKNISNPNYLSPTFTQRSLLRKNLIKDLNPTNKSNNNFKTDSFNFPFDINKFKEQKFLINDLSSINSPSFKSEVNNDTFNNNNKKSILKSVTKIKKKAIFVKKQQRPFSSDNRKIDG